MTQWKHRISWFRGVHNYRIHEDMQNMNTFLQKWLVISFNWYVTYTKSENFDAKVPGQGQRLSSLDYRASSWINLHAKYKKSNKITAMYESVRYENWPLLSY